MKILYIEDNYVNRLIIEKSMAKYATVVAEENGFKGIELGKSDDFDFILIDLNLADPEIDGFGVLKALKKEGVKAVTAAVTAFAGSDWKKKCLDAGFDLYFPKPVRAEELWVELNEFRDARNA
ncbi:MAG: response regulator [Cryomorphaceae bacterium]